MSRLLLGGEKMKEKMILIAGRTGAGKDTFASMLREMGMKGVVSYTTRKKRYETEDTHIFISKDEADKITDKVATTQIGEYEYFATRSQLEEADFYIVDPNGIEELKQNCPDIDFKIVYIYSDFDIRKQRALKRSENPDELKVFISRNMDEMRQFIQFENDLCLQKNLTVLRNETEKDMQTLKKEAEIIYTACQN